MTFSRAKPAGWTDDVDTITATQLNQIDTNQSNAADMAAGGAYSPSGVVEVDGSGIKSDLLVMDGDATVESTGTLQVDSGATVNLDVTLEFQGTTTTTAALIKKVNHASTGANDGVELTIEGQDGQTQSGAVANNDGGHVVLKPGAPGLSGTGADGGPGMLHVPTNNELGTGSPTGMYFGCIDVPTAVSTNVTLMLPNIWGSSRTSFVTLRHVSRDSGGTRQHKSIREFIVTSTAGNVPSATTDAGNPYRQQNSGYTGTPTVSVAGPGPAGQLELTVFATADAVAEEHTVFIEVLVTEAFA